MKERRKGGEEERILDIKKELVIKAGKKENE